MEDRVRFLAVDTDDLELGDQRILKPEEYLILNAEDEDAVGTGSTCFTMGYKEIPISRKEVELYILKILYKRFEEMNQKNEAALHASNALRERFEQFLRVCELDE